jgi:hypothetical protein
MRTGFPAHCPPCQPLAGSFPRSPLTPPPHAHPHPTYAGREQVLQAGRSEGEGGVKKDKVVDKDKVVVTGGAGFLGR